MDFCQTNKQVSKFVSDFASYELSIKCAEITFTSTQHENEMKAN